MEQTFDPNSGVFMMTNSANSPLHIFMTGVPMIQNDKNEKVTWFYDLNEAMAAYWKQRLEVAKELDFPAADMGIGFM